MAGSLIWLLRLLFTSVSLYIALPVERGHKLHFIQILCRLVCRWLRVHEKQVHESQPDRFLCSKLQVSHKHRNHSWCTTVSQWRTTVLTCHMSLVYCWQFAILLFQSPDNICNSQWPPPPSPYPNAQQQTSWCLWRQGPEREVEGELKRKKWNKKEFILFMNANSLP